jgi:hypothetical protein
VKSADLWRLHELATEFAASEYADVRPALGADLKRVAAAAAHAMADQACHGEVGAECKHEAAAEAAPPAQQVIACTPCLAEAKQATMRGATVPEVHPMQVIAGGMGLCEVRHGIQVEPPSLLIAQPGQMPPANGFGH